LSAFEKKVGEFDQKQEEIGFVSQEERGGILSQGTRNHPVEEGIAEIQRVFLRMPNEFYAERTYCAVNLSIWAVIARLSS
jgi:hypothetical protein